MRTENEWYKWVRTSKAFGQELVREARGDHRLQVVVDASVMLEGVKHKGEESSREVVSLAERGELEVIMVPGIVAELARVARRGSRFSRKVGDNGRERVINMIRGARVLKGDGHVSVRPADPDDLPYVEAWEEAKKNGKAGLVSRDRDLLDLNRPGIDHPREFLKNLAGKE